MKINTSRTDKMSGFTLMELLVVIAIFALASSVLLVAVQSTRSKARDARRISDLNMMHKAMGQYYDKYQRFPTPMGSDPQTSYNYLIATLRQEGILTGTVTSESQPAWWEIALKKARAGYMPATPNPDPNLRYEYNASSYFYDQHKNYRILVQLENPNNALSKGVSGPFLTPNVSTGTSACDPALRYYCIGELGTFVPHVF